MDKKSIQQKKWIFTTILAICFFLINQQSILAQNIRVTINMQNVPMESVMNEIEKQTKYLFISDKEVDIKQNVSVNTQNKPLSEALSQMVKGTDITYKISSSNILLSKQVVPVDKVETLSGIVYDEYGEPVIGASVAIDGTTNGTLTDIDGAFSLRASISGNTSLRVSFVGYEPVIVSVGNKTQFNVTLQGKDNILDAVVVTALGIKRSEKALSYNVTQIDAESALTVKSANFINSLSGKVAGLNINASSSGIGGASKVVMRGFSWNRAV